MMGGTIIQRINGRAGKETTRGKAAKKQRSTTYGPFQPFRPSRTDHWSEGAMHWTTER